MACWTCLPVELARYHAQLTYEVPGVAAKRLAGTPPSDSAYIVPPPTEVIRMLPGPPCACAVDCSSVDVPPPGPQVPSPPSNVEEFPTRRLLGPRGPLAPLPVRQHVRPVGA